MRIVEIFVEEVSVRYDSGEFAFELFPREPNELPEGRKLWFQAVSDTLIPHQTLTDVESGKRVLAFRFMPGLHIGEIFVLGEDRPRRFRLKLDGHSVVDESETRYTLSPDRPLKLLVQLD